MRMRGGYLGSLLAMASMAVATSAAPVLVREPVPVAAARAKARRRAARVAMGSPRKAVRSRWKAQRRQLKPNRIHVSRRVRRRHRKAA